MEIFFGGVGGWGRVLGEDGMGWGKGKGGGVGRGVGLGFCVEGRERGLEKLTWLPIFLFGCCV